jgi:hypothetical protein
LGFKLFSIDFFGFLFENSFNQNGFVLELITLGSKVESVVQSSIDFFRSSIFPQESSQDSLSSDPEDFGWHSCLSGTFLFTGTSVSTFSFCL